MNVSLENKSSSATTNQINSITPKLQTSIAFVYAPIPADVRISGAK